MNKYNYFEGQHRIGWPDHWTNGGTGLTKGVTAEIRESVDAFGDSKIYVEGDELHTTRKPVDLSDFWKFHDERHPLNK